jgi:hypothetical protein
VDEVYGGVPHLLKQSPFLDDVGNRFLFDALLLVHVLERVEFLAPLVLYNTNLETRRG